MFIVMKFDDELQREVGVNADGETHYPQNAQLFFTEKRAAQVARKFGGSVHDEERIFGSDLGDEADDL